MSRTATPAPLSDRSYWRRLLATVHPDRDGGDEDLFVFLQGLREHVEECCDYEATLHRSRRRDPSTSSPARSRRRDEEYQEEPERIPFDEQLGHVDEFVTLTLRGISVGQHAGEPYRSVLGLLIDCPAEDHGRRALRQCRGATWKQAAYIAHLFIMAKEQRVRWYELCRSIPLSQAHAEHIISRLKQRTGEEAA